MRPLLAALALAVLAACSTSRPDAADPVVCTMEFRTVAVQVVDAAGNPVDGLTSTVRNLRTGEALDFGDDASILGGEGRYLVATDAHREQLSADGDRLLFQATGDGLAAEAEVVVSADPCHIQKESGPEQIVVEPAGG